MAASGVAKYADPAVVERKPTTDIQFFSFIEELSEPLQKLATKAWEARGKLIHDVVAYVSMGTTMVISMPGRTVRVINNPKLWALLAEEEDPEALAFVLVGSGSAMSLGSAGAAFGLTVGGTAGAALGAIPALFTFGLSIPLGAVVGSVGGLVVGGATGGTAGFVGGGSTAYAFAASRHSIISAYNRYILLPANRVKEGAITVHKKSLEAKDATKAAAQAAVQNLCGAASDSRVQVTLLSAGAGATALGTAGAACGTLAGATAGALLGVVPAVFTFGLSIPIGAMIGGGGGLCLGTATGSTVGFVGGGGAAALAFVAPGALTQAKDQAIRLMTNRGKFTDTDGLLDGHKGIHREGSTGCTD
mmetsp:Transcript_21876/g.51085  ORF Transcript_21876/g.51085 Transcript_21876/m.51085 type:complete len:361 (+) Transcript_21876:99-1181(+)